MRHDAEAGHGSRNKTDRVGAGLVDILCLDGLLFGMRLRTNVRTRLVGGNLDNLEFGGCNFFLYDHTLTAVTELRKALTEDHLLSSIHSLNALKAGSSFN